ncbi:MAG TPA: hypothetical protein VFX77_10070 [Rubrobacter sp.]|nr:hypothetical protein [Rubrobacter sp.]
MGETRWRTGPRASISARNPPSGTVGDHKKRSPLASRETTMRVGNGIEPQR